MTPSTAFWQAVSAIHDPVYFAPDAKERYGDLGLKGFWRGYFASRAGALGTPSAELVIATFHGFAPSMVRRAVPECWELADRDAVLDTRVAIARDLLAPLVGDPERVANGLAAILPRIDWAGKPLGAAHAALPSPDDAVGRLWWAATALREYRGDCHIAVLTAAGLDGATANVLALSAGLVPANQQANRGWTDDEWAAGIERLRQRGWTDPAGTITDAGRSARAQLEAATDRVCAAGLDEEIKARTLILEGPLTAFAHAIGEAGLLPVPSPTAARMTP